MRSVYILELEQGKWYIGSSTDVGARLYDHFTGKGCAWTTRYKPVDVTHIYENASPFDEDRYTKEYMNKYGIDNVRGAAYVQFDLDVATKAFIDRELKTANNLCFKCGQPGHYIKECATRCATCGRNNHDATYCYARTHLDGHSLVERCERCHREGHNAHVCRATTYTDGRDIPQTSFLHPA